MTDIARHDTSRTGDLADPMLMGAGTPVEMSADRPYFVARFSAASDVSGYVYYDHLKDEWSDRHYVDIEHVASARTRDEAIAAIFATITSSPAADITVDMDSFRGGDLSIRCGDALLTESTIDETGFVPVVVADMNFVVGQSDFKASTGSDRVGVWYDDRSAAHHLGDRCHGDVGALIGDAISKELATKVNDYAEQGLEEVEAQRCAAADMSPEGATPYTYADMVATAGDVARNWQDFVDSDAEDARPCAWRFASRGGWCYQISAGIIEHARASQTILVDVAAEALEGLRSDGTLARAGIETKWSPNPDNVTLAGTPAQYKDLHAALTERAGAQDPPLPGGEDLAERIDTMLHEANPSQAARSVAADPGGLY